MYKDPFFDERIEFYPMSHIKSTDSLFNFIEEDELEIYMPQVFIGAFLLCLSPVNRVRHNKFKNIEFNYIPVPGYKPNTPNFADTVRIVAENMWKDNEKITVSWSGGIDSTTALCALIETCDNWKDRLRVIYTDTSVLEYPEFHEKFVTQVKDNVLCSEHDLFTKHIPNALDDSLVTSGECGDQIFGSMILASNPGSMIQPYQSILDWDHLLGPDANLHRSSPVNNVGKVYKDLMFNYIEEQLSYCPFEVKSVFDFYWWLNYTLKWNLCVYRVIGKVPVGNEFKIKNWYPFYNAPELHQWSISHHEEKVKVGGNWKTYKQPAKDYIFTIAGDEDYRDNKVKTASLSEESRKLSGSISFINESGKIRPWVEQEYVEKLIDIKRVPYGSDEIPPYFNEVYTRMKPFYDFLYFYK